MAPYVIKKVTAAPIQLPTLIVESEYGTKKVHPSVWNAKTLKFSEGMPQKVVVKKNDSLFTLSKRYGVPLPLIIEKNRLTPPFSIYPGQILILVGPKVHIVQKGENLYEIAKLHNVSLSVLARQNSVPSDQPIVQAGQQLILPAPQATATLPPPLTLTKKLSPAAPLEQGTIQPIPVPRSSLREPPFVFPKTPQRSGSKFGWPVKGHLISRFGSKGRGLYNDGINIAAPHRTKVRAADNGIVVYQGSDIKSYGNLVLVKHEGGWMSAYAHLESVAVQKGQIVKKRDVLGNVGVSGFVKHPQLHFELRKEGKPKDPLNHLQANDV